MSTQFTNASGGDEAGVAPDQDAQPPHDSKLPPAAPTPATASPASTSATAPPPTTTTTTATAPPPTTTTATATAPPPTTTTTTATAAPPTTTTATAPPPTTTPPTTTAPAAISCRNIVQTFGSVRAVDGVDLDITSGSVTALLGANGAGKSTLLDICLGLVPPRAGTATIFGLPPREAIQRGYVGAAQQSIVFPSAFTVKSALTATAAMWQSHLPIADLVDALALGPIYNRRVKALSGGERRRLALAVALLPNPHLLCLDEPTTGLDVTARHEFWTFIHSLTGSGRTLLFATHYLEEAAQFASDIVIMGRGRIIAQGDLAHIQQYAASHLTVTIPTRWQPEITARLERIPDPITWHFDGERLTVRGGSLDDTARTVMALPEAANLVITPATLDEAFTTVTKEASNE